MERALGAVSVLVALIGLYVAYLLYYKKPGTADAIAQRNRRAYDLVENKYWVDEFYSNFIVTPLLMFTRGFVELIFERGVVNGSARFSGLVTRGFAWLTRKQISGNIRSYAGWLAIGAAAVLAIMVFGRTLWVRL
jgi:NADH-quinone oxidoreductase subunit L